MKFWKSIVNYFIQGILFIVPITLTIWVIAYVFNYLDQLTRPIETELLGFEIPGMGLLILALFLVFIGFIGSSIVFRPLIGLIERLINRAPLIKDVYSSIKDLLSAFVGNKKKFNHPVLVTMNETGLKRIGFLSRSGMPEMNIDKDSIIVYLPYSYGLMGTVIIVKKDMVEKINQPATEVMKFIVSGGVTEYKNTKINEEN
jgi:uncharacterized membrane protein